MEEKPYVQTYTMIAGSLACDAACLYCVAKMTPTLGLTEKLPEVNWRNFHKGAELANLWGAVTALITSKGESALFHDQIKKYVQELKKHNYPLIELQTNGIRMYRDEKYKEHLKEWYDLGLTTIAVSIGHYDSKKNAELVRPRTGDPINLDELIDKLHNITDNDGFSVRLTAMMVKNYLDNLDEVMKLRDYAKKRGVEQLTVRGIERPVDCLSAKVAKYVDDNRVSQEVVDGLRDYFDKHAVRLKELVHGGVVYDVDGQNLCVSNCLTINKKDETAQKRMLRWAVKAIAEALHGKDTSIRQIIFFPDGHVRYAWQYPGAILF